MNRRWLLAFQVTLPLACLFAIAIGLWGSFWIPTDPNGPPGADLIAIYAGARLALDDPAEMYSPFRQAEVQAQAAHLNISANDPDFLPFAYPAATALLFAPLTVLPYVGAYWVMVGLNLTTLGLLVWLLSSRLALGPEASQLLALATTVSAGVLATLLQGQLSILAAFALSLALLDMREGRDLRAGMWAGLLSLKPVLLPGIVIWLACRRRWRTLLVTGAVGGLFAVISLAWIGSPGLDAYQTLAARMLDGSVGTAQPMRLINLRGLSHSLGLGDPGWLVLLAGLALTVGFARVEERWDEILLVLMVPLMAMHVNIQGFSLLIPATALAAGLIPMTNRNQRLIVIAVFVAGWSSVWTRPILPFSLLTVALWITLSRRFRGPRLDQSPTV